MYIVWPDLHCKKSGGFDLGGQLLTPCFPLEALRGTTDDGAGGWGHTDTATFPINGMSSSRVLLFQSFAGKYPPSHLAWYP